MDAASSKVPSEAWADQITLSEC